MYGDFDSAIEQLFIWQEWHAAWLYRIRPRRIMPRNYLLPDFLADNNAYIQSEPLPREPGIPRKHLVEPIDSDTDAAPPVPIEGDPRRDSDASESDFTGQSTGGENPDFEHKEKSDESSSEISDTSETSLSGWDSPAPPPSRRKINK